MPSYDYICRKCGKKFTLVMTISEHDSKKIRCPKCSSVRVGTAVSFLLRCDVKEELNAHAGWLVPSLFTFTALSR